MVPFFSTLCKAESQNGKLLPGTDYRVTKALAGNGKFVFKLHTKIMVGLNIILTIENNGK